MMRVREDEDGDEDEADDLANPRPFRGWLYVAV
jgi:hypothetical protein